MAACEWDTTDFLIVSANVFDRLIYYSHIVPLVISLTIGFFVLYKNPKQLLSRILFVITSLFSVWVFFDLILWATDKPYFTMFFWSLLVIIEPIIYATCLYFIQVFITGKDTTLKNKIVTTLFLLPTFFLINTHYALLGYNLINCDREVIEGPLTQFGYLIEIVYTLWILIFSMERFRKIKNNNVTRKQIVLVTVGILLFLLTFSSGNIIGTITNDWRIPQWGIFGMPIFIGFLAYLIVKYRTFDIKLVATQALAIMMSILIGSQFFFIRTPINQFLNGITFFISVIGGILLVRSVKKQIKQREQVESFLEAGFTSEALISYLLASIEGAPETYYCDLDKFATNFDVTKVHQAHTRFSDEVLKIHQSNSIKEMGNKDYRNVFEKRLAIVKPHLFERYKNDPDLQKLLLMRRSNLVDDKFNVVDFGEDFGAIDERLLLVARQVEKFITLNDLGSSKKSLMNGLEKCKEGLGLSKKDYYMSLRIMYTGKMYGLGLDDLLSYLEKKGELGGRIRIFKQYLEKEHGKSAGFGKIL